MRRIIKKVIPVGFISWYHKQRSPLKNMSTSQVFTQIYTSNQWNSTESVSGTGSEVAQVKSLVSNLIKLFNELNIKSVLDIPCGDFNWVKNIDFSNINYIGADIVVELINKNNRLYAKSQISFQVLDIITDSLPKSDIIFIRDCFVHLSEEDIFKSIENIKLSGCKYILTTTFTETQHNYDIPTGAWRTLNLQKKPFNFPDPILVINENCTEGNGEFKDKSLALWEISRL